MNVEATGSYEMMAYVGSIRFLIIYIKLEQYEPTSCSGTEERIKIFDN